MKAFAKLVGAGPDMRVMVRFRGRWTRFCWCDFESGRKEVRTLNELAESAWLDGYHAGYAQRGKVKKLRSQR